MPVLFKMKFQAVHGEAKQELCTVHCTVHSVQYIQLLEYPIPLHWQKSYSMCPSSNMLMMIKLSSRYNYNVCE